MLRLSVMQNLRSIRNYLHIGIDENVQHAFVEQFHSKPIESTLPHI